MNTQQNQVTEDVERLKEIPKWTRKYAQNRTLTILVLSVITMLFGIFFALLFVFPFTLALRGFSKGNIILGCVGIAVFVALLAAYFKCLFVFIRKYGGRNRGLIAHKIDQWIYGREGMTSMPMPEGTRKKKWFGIAVSIVWWCLFMGTMYLGMANVIPAKYVQPISALYMVPWFVFIYLLQRPKVGPLFLICPILYTIHTLLILAGMPMFFTGGWCGFSMVLPFFGYSFSAYVIAHLYSRYALKKLKTTAYLQENNNEQ